MAHRLIFALTAAAIAAPISATGPGHDHMAGGAPHASASAKYCMKVEPVTGTRLETVQCWTRAEWASQGVDVDKEWAREGVRVIA